MAWIESHESLREHPKTKRAARALGLQVAHMVGHLHLLWWWALTYAQDGDLSRYDPADVADAAGWSGDARQFVDALLGCGPGTSKGFLEESADGRLVIHDWWDYAGKLLEKRKEDADRKRRSRSTAPPQDVQRTSSGHPTDNQRSGDRTALVTVPNQDNLTEQDDDDARAHADTTPPPPQSSPDADLWTLIQHELPALMASNRVREQVTAYVEDLGPELVLEACKRTIDAGVRTFPYLRSICDTWTGAGVKTLADVLVLDKQHEQRKNKRGAAGKGSSGPSEPKAWAAIRAGLEEGSEPQ